MIAEILRAQGIAPRHFGLGTQRLACPECARAKHRARDTALALTIEADGAVWLCHRCGFKGGTLGNTPNLHARRAEVIELADRKASMGRDQHADKAELARQIWGAAVPAEPSHPYLSRKRLTGEGLRHVTQFQSLRNALLVPMRAPNGEIINLQGIDPAGQKRFLAGAQTRGAFALIGGWHRGTTPDLISIGEGWATVAAFLCMWKKYSGVAAMSCGNLVATAQCLREKFPAARICVLGDQDKAGIRAATIAQVAVHGDMMIPGFRHAGTNDFSDLWARNA